MKVMGWGVLRYCDIKLFGTEIFIGGSFLWFTSLEKQGNEQDFPLNSQLTQFDT